jgi:uncharacterized membrane protein
MNTIFKALLRYMVKGMIVVIPLGAAIFLIVWTVAKIDSSLNMSDAIWVDPTTGQPMYIPGLGILTVLLIILLAGIIVTNLVTEPIRNWFIRWLNRLPLFNFLYSSIKDLTEAFVGDEKKFSEPVIVEVNETGLKKIGFLTQKDLTKLGLENQVAVYFPFSYSFAGQLVIVNSDKVKPLNINAGEAMKFVVSGGVTHI